MAWSITRRFTAAARIATWMFKNESRAKDGPILRGGIPPLTQLLNDKNEAIRKATAEALKKIKEKTK